MWGPGIRPILSRVVTRQAAILLVLLVVVGCDDDDAASDAGATADASMDAGDVPPDGLPFEFERPATGKPPLNAVSLAVDQSSKRF